MAFDKKDPFARLMGQVFPGELIYVLPELRSGEGRKLRMFDIKLAQGLFVQEVMEIKDRLAAFQRNYRSNLSYDQSYG